MWLAVIAVLAGCAAGRVAGGRWTNAAHAPVRWISLLVAGSGCEAIAAIWVSGDLGLALVVCGYILMLAFALRNLAFTGSILVAVGLACNLLVIGIDGGMPVRGAAPGVSLGPDHHGEQRGDRLVGLSDVVYVRPLGEVVSAGDLTLAIGIGTMAAFALLSDRRSVRAARS